MTGCATMTLQCHVASYWKDNLLADVLLEDCMQDLNA